MMKNSIVLRKIFSGRELANKAFTLIELLITVTIFSIIALSLSGVLFSGINLWQRAWTVSFPQADIFLEFENISRRLHQSLYIEDVPFLGSSEKIEFPVLDGDNILKVVYSFNSGTRALSYQKMPYEEILAGEDKEYRERTLFEADEVSFKYFVSDGQESYLWKNAIDEEGGMPAAVKINVMLDESVFEKIIFLPVHG